VIDKEFLVVVLGFEKFMPYLMGSYVFVFTGHAILKHLSRKRMLNLHSFYGSYYSKSLIVKLKIKRSENAVMDHLSRIVISDTCKNSYF